MTNEEYTDKLTLELAAALALNAKFRQVLEWYADPHHWISAATIEGGLVEAIVDVSSKYQFGNSRAQEVLFETGSQPAETTCPHDYSYTGRCKHCGNFKPAEKK